MQFIVRRSIYAALAFAVVLVAITASWLKSGHTQAEPIHVAQEFLQKLEAQQFPQAFELTVKQGYIGQTPTELQTISERELCKVERMVSTFPFQSNGNRLRRRLSGEEIEMPQVQVEFAGGCLLGVTVRRTRGNEWRVYRFASHAG